MTHDMDYDLRHWLRLVEADARKAYHRKWIDTPAFQRWFADSRIVDAEGDPLLVFHGSPVKIPYFEPNDVGGFFFTADHNYAANHIVQIKGGEGGYLHPSFLAIRNPKIITPPAEDWSVLPHERRYIRQAKAEGHDGLILHSSGRTVGAPFYVAFRAVQIKSFNNSGKFDPTSPYVAEASAI